MVIYNIFLVLLVLSGAQCNSVFRTTELRAKRNVETFYIGQQNEEFDDPAKEWFSDDLSKSEITTVRIEYYEKDGTKFVRCVGFSNPDYENNCPEEPSNSAHTVEDFTLASDEYINYISGDSFHNILSIYFRTNKGQEIGPFGVGKDPEEHMFKLSPEENERLVFVEGLKGLWVYSLYFTFDVPN